MFGSSARTKSVNLNFLLEIIGRILKAKLNIFCFNSYVQNSSDTLAFGYLDFNLHKTAFCFRVQMCERGDSNPHPVRDRILSPARLPIPPLSHSFTIYHNT